MHELGLNNGREIVNAGTGEKGSGKTTIFVDRQARLEFDGLSVFSIHMQEIPGSFRPPERERQEPVTEQILRVLRGPAILKIFGASYVRVQLLTAWTLLFSIHAKIPLKLPLEGKVTGPPTG